MKKWALILSLFLMLAGCGGEVVDVGNPTPPITVVDVGNPAPAPSIDLPAAAPDASASKPDYEEAGEEEDPVEEDQPEEDDEDESQIETRRLIMRSVYYQIPKIKFSKIPEY